MASTVSLGLTHWLTRVARGLIFGLEAFFLVTLSQFIPAKDMCGDGCVKLMFHCTFYPFKTDNLLRRSEYWREDKETVTGE